MKQDRNVKKENWKKKPAAGKQGRSLDDKFEEWVGEKTGKQAGKSSEQKTDQKEAWSRARKKDGKNADQKSARDFACGKVEKFGKSARKDTMNFGKKSEPKRGFGDSPKSGKLQSAAEEKKAPKKKGLCPVAHRCGGCQYLDMPYAEQLQMKQSQMQKLLGNYCKVHGIKGMDDPFHYRNKVHAVFGYRKGEAISGVYEEKTHNIVPVETCMIEDQKADEIIGTIRGMLKSFKIRTYDEDTGYGLLRHVLVRRGFTSGQIMVVLVTASPVFPSKNNFVKALRQKHPEITTIVQNINNRGTSMVLGDKEHVLFGKGYIEDELCGCKFRISPKSFYQVNPVQTEYLYGKAIELAGLTGNEHVLDAYCGIGTIGIIAASKAKEVIGVELNADAVRDAVQNAKCNDVKNIRFYCNDATEFMMQMAASGDTVDVVLMDPPRAGSTEAFIKAVSAVKAKSVIYVSCGPDTLARDLGVFKKMGYQAEGAWPVDMFPQTGHVETVVLLSHKKADSYIHIDVEFGEGEGKIPVDSIAKRAEAYKPKEKVTYKMIKEYIEAKYGFKVHTAYIAEVKRNLGLPMYDAPNAVEELKQPRKHPTPEKVEAIKDALRYFAVI